MKKDHIRDYATEAFRFYAKVGSKEKYINHIIEDIQRQANGLGISKPTEAALVNKEKLMESRKAELDDIEAVSKTLNILEMSKSGGSIIKAIEYVYFKDCWREPGWGDIRDRIHYAEIHIPASERQIYRWLKKARDTFAEERGLRIA